MGRLAGVAILLGAAAGAACNGGRGSSARTEKAGSIRAGRAPPLMPLRGEVLSPTQQRLNAPGDLAVVGPFLVVLDPLADSVVAVLDRATGTLVTRAGRLGRGPGEIAAPWSLDPVPDGSGFWVYDFALRRLTRFDLPWREERGRRPVRHTRLVSLLADATLYGPVWIGSRVASLGFFADGRRVWVFDSTGAHTGAFGELPSSPVDAPTYVLEHAYQATLVVNPIRTRMAVLTRHAGHVTIFGTDGSLVADTSGPEPFEPEFSVARGARGPVMATDEHLRFGYLDGWGTDSYLFALFSGRRRADFPGEANFGEYVHVFDWQGRLQAVWKLDAAALSIAVDPEGRTLYAVRHHPEPAVVRYALPG